jgi:hypothetical protein
MNLVGILISPVPRTLREVPVSCLVFGNNRLPFSDQSVYLSHKGKILAKLSLNK